ncbi:acetate/propionate family kinase [Pararhizobium sp. IMCC21322]|uniref:acetate/propionate family kinase n=1 Tax=Pararhizobium sp. IMCC21322 TaxID=3067903 RepID=UPI0027423613|nr:acetate/propionate family kinase [Pararhizobium sp. IMCC21322]
MTGILILNTGSSSLKFGLYRASLEPEMLVDGQVDRIGLAARLSVKSDASTFDQPVTAATHSEALAVVLKALESHREGLEIVGIGHRIVHGGVHFTEPAVLTPSTIEALQKLCPLAPLHQPHNLAGVEMARKAFPDAVQIGCFDTSFHRSHPWVNDTFALPRFFYDQGVRRYGFHGLSYDYITGVLARDYPELHQGRVVVAHLGNGASMCAIKAGRSIGSTMGFTALDGLPMGTRCGQLDPGVVLYMMQQNGMSPEDVNNLLYTRSGLLGLSGQSSDMRSLLASENPQAAEAIDYYVFRARREIGAMTAVLSGLDALVFCGGIGENAAVIRERIVDGLDYLGLSVDQAQNQENAHDIGNGATRLMVIPTDEERIIARAVQAHLPSAPEA